jgi:hypothetical protein
MWEISVFIRKYSLIVSKTQCQYHCKQKPSDGIRTYQTTKRGKEKTKEENTGKRLNH